MEASNDIMIRISPNEGKITVEEDAQGVFSRKSITEEDLLRCFKDSLRTADEGYHSGFLPLNTISLYQSETVKRFVLWHPRLYADVSVYDTPYPHFPIPRLVFGFSLNQEGKASHCRIGVVADEIPTPETPMYYYPFSNVSRESGSLCVGANTLPIYKKPHKAHNLPAFLLRLERSRRPNNASSSVCLDISRSNWLVPVMPARNRLITALLAWPVSPRIKTFLRVSRAMAMISMSSSRSATCARTSSIRVSILFLGV